MSVFTIIVLSFLVITLWLPPVLCARVLKYRLGVEVSRLLWLVLPSQLLLTIGLVLLAQYIGLLNPAGYVLGTTVLVSFGGAIAVALGHPNANPSFKRDA